MNEQVIGTIGPAYRTMTYREFLATLPLLVGPGPKGQRRRRRRKAQLNLLVQKSGSTT